MNAHRSFCILFIVCFFSLGGRLQAETLKSKDPDALPSRSSAVQEEAVEEEDGGAYYQATEVLQVEVIALEGEVGVKPREGEYGPVEEGALLESGTTIRTGPGAALELGFDEADENIVRVEEETTVVLLLKEDEKIELLQGEVFAIINDLPGGASFEIRTPTAVAGARGTEWATRYKDETTDVEAFDDTPYVKSFDSKGKLRSRVVDVKPGFATSVRRSERPAKATRISDTRRRQWRRKRQGLKKRVQSARQRRGRPERDPKKLRRFKAKARKGDPRIQQMKERARGRSGRSLKDAKGETRARRKGSGDFKERIEKGDSWRERLKKYTGRGTQKGTGSKGKEDLRLRPGDARSKEEAGKEQVRKKGEAGRKGGQVTNRRSRRDAAPKRIPRSAPTAASVKR